MSVLSRPQNEWDEFLQNEDRRRSRSPFRKLLWLVIPAAFVVVALVCFRYLS
ncbi:MAG: hypothetical protein ABIJ00_00325 [Candidatus Eisenbacteria bacterium]